MSTVTGYSRQNGWMRPVAMVLSLVTSVVYFIIAFGFVPDDFESPPALVMFAAGVAYLVGGVIILRAGKRLLRLGLILNLLVLIIFAVSAIGGNSTLDALGLSGKFAQMGLEVVLAMIVLKEDERPLSAG